MGTKSCHSDVPGQLLYMGLILRLSEWQMAARLWTNAPEHVRSLLLSKGGDQVGMTWTGLPDPGGKHLPDGHWRVVTLERIGLLEAPAGATCGLPRRKGRQGCCGAGLDRNLRHLWHCRTNVARLRIHNALAGTLGQELRAAGGNVDLERAVPELSRRSRCGQIEVAILDVITWFPAGTEWFPVDVTVRYAGATRYVGAERTAGTAAKRGEQEKFKKYGAGVGPLAFEQGGRLGPAGKATLDRLAEAAVAARPGATTKRQLVLRWRRRLEAALLFAVGDSILLALGGSAVGTVAAHAFCAGQGELDIERRSAGPQEPPCAAACPCTEEMEAAAQLHSESCTPGSA